MLHRLSPVILAKNLRRSDKIRYGEVLIKRTWRDEWGISVIIFAHRQHLKEHENLRLIKSSHKFHSTKRDELKTVKEILAIPSSSSSQHIPSFPNENLAD